MILFAALMGSVHASPVVNLKSYVSASGHYALEVDPTALYGQGPGHYRLLLDGREAWNKTLPFTLYDAVVMNDGTAIGYAYDHSYEGFGLQGGFAAGMGNLHVVVLDPQGTVRLDEVNKRKFSMIPHAPAKPVVRGILFQEGLDRFTIRTFTDQGENWWNYQISTGKSVARFDLRKACAAPAIATYVDAARSVPGTPLVLLQWGAHARKSPEYRTIFMLVTQAGRSVWTREVPTGYSETGDDAADDKLRQAIRNGEGIPAQAHAGQFELWLVAEAQRVLFRVTPDATVKEGWRVEEVSRHPYQLPKDEKPAPLVIENRPLRSLGDFKLEAPAPASPIRDIVSFEFDAEGRIGMIQKEGKAFTLLDSAGKVLADVPLPDAVFGAQIGRISMAAVGGDKWVLLASEEGQEAKCWGWWFDSADKQLGNAFPLICPGIDAVTGDGAGGFIALATRRNRSSSGHELHAFDPQGGRRWVQTESHDNSPGSLFSPEDIALIGKETLAVLDNILNTVQIFGLDGKYRRSVRLKAKGKNEINYPTKIVSDVQGGFVIYDVENKPPYTRIKADGTVRGSLRPRHADGRVVDTMAGMRVAPDGRIWVSDQQSLLRLTEKGVVDLTLGRQPNPEELEKIAAVAADRSGHLYAVDERTGAVHVFDAEGKRLRICQPGPGDFTENLRSPHLTVADDGSVFLRGDDLSGRPDYLHFGPDGSRLGIRDGKIKDRQNLYAQPGTQNFLVTVYQFAGLIGPKGEVLKAIERRADRLWLDSISGAAFASDGSFALHSQPSEGGWNTPVVTVFTREGNAVRTFPLPSGWFELLGYNGSHLVLRRESEIQIFDHLGAPVQSFAAPEGNGWGNGWGMVLTRDGRELWSVDYLTRAVQRYAMP